MAQERPDAWEMLSLLAACLRPLFGTGAAPDALFRPAFGWEELIRVSGDHLMTPALACSLRGHPDLPSDVRDYFDAILTMNRARNAQIRRAIMGLAPALNALDVRPVLLKGAAMLIGGIHRDPAIRALGDVDMLVPEARLAACVEACAAIGYNPLPGHATAHHATPQLNRETGCEIELHREPVMRHLRAMLPAATMLARAHPLPLEGAVIALPCPTDMAVHAILHSELADQYAALRRLSFRTLTDLAALQTSGDPPDWAEVGDRLTRHGHRRTWETMRSQLATLLDIHVGKGPIAALPDAYRRKAVDPAYGRLDGLRFRARRRLDRFVAEPTTALEVLRPGWWKRRWDEIAAPRR
jgi:hypothetical protein